jgi:DNA gyrase subunit B
MYIGDVHDGSALHHLVWEAVDNAVDEHLAGYCKAVTITVHFDGSVTVEDDGRGIPVGIMEDRGVSAAEVVMTVLHAGGKFDHSSYKVSAGLHGVGVSAVNAVSETLRLEIKREGKLWFQEYHRGAPVGNIAAIGETSDTGTKITFKPDHEIFTNLEYSFDILANRLRELAFLNSGLIVHLKDERDGGRNETYEYKGGIKEFVSLLSQAKEPVHDDVIALLGEFPSSEGKAPVTVDLAIQWTNAYAEQILCYTNNVANTRKPRARFSTRPSWPPRPARLRARPARSCAKACSISRRFPASSPTVKAKIRASARFTSSKVRAPGAAPSKAATGTFRRFCRSKVKS